MACSQETVMEPASIRFTNLSPELGWKDYQILFSQFGQITKLFIEPSKKFGHVQFSNIENAYKAQKELDGKPPLKLVLTNPTRINNSQTPSPSSNASSLENSINMNRRFYNRQQNNNADEVEVVTSDEQYVDVYGRVLDTLEDGKEVYIPLSDLKRSGFEVFRRRDFDRCSQREAFNEQQFIHFETYLRAKARKFMISKALLFSDDIVNGAINKQKNEYRDFYQGGHKVFNNGTNLIAITSPSSTSNQRGRNPYPNRGMRHERSSFPSQERKGYSNYKNSMYTTDDWGNHSAANGSSTASTATTSRRSYNDEKSSNSSRGMNRGYFNDKNGSPRKFVQRDESDNIPKPPVRATLAKDTLQPVKIVHLETETVAWVQLASHINLVRDIMLQTMEESPKANVTSPSIDKICAALYFDVWFRVIVLSTYPLTVQFIDFGSKNVGDVEEIRDLSDKLRNIPGQAVRIRMEFGSDLTLEPSMEFTIKPILQEDDGTYLVCAQKPPPAQEISPPPQQHSPQTRRVSFAAEEPEPKTTSSPSVDKPLLRRPNSITPEKEIKPEVTSSPTKEVAASTNSPTTSISACTAKPRRKTVIETEADSGFFDCTEVISEDTFVGIVMPTTYVEQVFVLDEITNDCKPDPTFKPNLGDTVAVLNSDAYVRGVIINNLNGRYSCALVDYGTTVSVDEVRPLPEKYMNIPEFACLCRADLNIIEELLKGSEHPMQIKSPSRITVTLNGKVCEIVGYPWNPFETSALAIQKNKSVEDKPISEKAIHEKQQIYKTPPKQYQLKQGDFVILESEVESSLIIRSKECAITLKEIEKELRNYQGKPFTEQLEVQQLVVCPFTDGALYRGIILSIEGPNALVEYIDYGNCDRVPIKELKTINEKLANFPNTCIKISLQGFVGTKFSPKALSFLAKCSDNREKFIVNLGSDNNVCDLLFRDKGKSSLSEELIALDKPTTPAKPKTPEAPSSSVKAPSKSTTPKAPSPVVEAPPKASKPSDSVVKPPSPSIVLTDIPRCQFNIGSNEVMCLFSGDIAEGTASFCLADPDKIAVKMTELSIKINAHIEKDPSPYHPKQFEVCLAKFEDEWYRAALIKGFENTYGMFYLDYGNTQTVTAEDIRKMPKELAEIECLSALCILHGVKQDEQPIKEPLLLKMVDSIKENEVYNINVVKEDDNCYVITIPSLFDQWKKEGLL